MGSGTWPPALPVRLASPGGLASLPLARALVSRLLPLFPGTHP